MDLTEWLTTHHASWVKRPQRLVGDLRPTPYLGDGVTANEWLANPDSPVLFTHIESYDSLKEPDTLFLFGRRGTGKSELLQMLQFQVRTRRVKDYGSAWVLLSDVLSDKLSLLVNSSSLAALSNREKVRLLANCWQWLFGVGAMAGAIAQQRYHGNGSTVSPRLSAYVDCTIDGKTDNAKDFSVWAAKKLSKLILDVQPDGGGAEQNARWVHNIESALESAAFLEAAEAARAFVGHDFQLVMLDGDEVFQTTESVVWELHTALIQFVSEAYTERNQTRIVAKAALPSEIYPFLRPHNREKVEGKNTFIHWKYRDLVTLVAKRFLWAVESPQNKDAYVVLASDVAAADKYLREYLPGTIDTRSGVTMPTMAYFIRHTQKKPRQLIELLNAVLTLSKSENHAVHWDLRQHERTIRDGIHGRLHALVDGTIDTYSRVYPGADRIMRTVMNGSRAYFAPDQLDGLVKHAAALRGEANLTAQEVKLFLFQSGVLGVARYARQVRGIGECWMLEAQYEYQVKAHLIPAQQQLCVVHPMFFEVLGTTIDERVTVYPAPFEDEERVLMNNLGLGFTPRR